MFKWIVFILISTSNLKANETKDLSLKKYIKIFLRNNPKIKISLLDVKISEASFIKSKGEFDLSFTYNFSKGTQNTPVSSTLDTTGNASSVKTETTTNTFTLSKLFSTGTTLTLPYELKKVDSDSTFRIFRLTYEPSMSLQLNQPVLQTFFSGYHTKDKTFAKKQWEEKSYKEREKVEKLVYEQIEKFYSLLEAKKSFQISKNSMNTALKNFNFIKKKKVLGKSSILEFYESQASLSKAQERLLRDEIRFLKSYENVKRDIDLNTDLNLNSQNNELNSKNYNFPHNKSKMYENAIKNRGDYLANKHGISTYQFKRDFASVDKLPTLDFDASYSSQAIRANQSDASDDLLDRKYKTWSLGLTLTHKIPGSAAKGSYLQNSLKLQKEQIKMKQLKKGIILEIEIALKNFNTQKKVVSSLKSSMNMEEKKMDYYQRQFLQGTLSSFEIAKHIENKNKAVLEFHKAQYKLERDYYNLFKTQGLLTRKFLQ